MIHKLKTLWLYQTPPLDFFDGLLTVEEIAKRDDPIGRFDGRAYESFGGALSPMELFLIASRACRERWGDGDVVAGPYVMPLPLGEPCLGFLLLWKHCHAGATYVASPVPLPWLDALCVFKIDCRHGQATPSAADPALRVVKP